MIQLKQELQGVTELAIAGHIHPDGDSLGACLGLMHYIYDNFPGIRVDVWLEDPGKKFGILEGYEKLQKPNGEEKKYELFISVDCAARDRLGGALPYFESAGRTLCVDHHVSNQGFAQKNVVVPEASSTCEVLCGMMEPECISKAAAAALYTGIAHDTGVFQYSCTSPGTMRTAAMLMEKGIPHTQILEKTFYKRTYCQNQVLGKSLLESMRVLDGRCIVSAMKKKEMVFFDADPLDLEGIVSQMKLTEGVEVAIFMYEVGSHEFKVSLRSEEKVDVSVIASYFGGGGHKRAAGANMQGTFHDIVNNLLLHIEKQLKEQETV